MLMVRKRFKLQPWEIFPCPRCASPDTRFFCYNGRDGTKPKHYCNACRRYWIRGSTLRHAKRVPQNVRSARPRPASSSTAQVPLSSSPATVTVDRPPRLPYSCISHQYFSPPATERSYVHVAGEAAPSSSWMVPAADQISTSPGTAAGRLPPSSCSTAIVSDNIVGGCHGGGEAPYCGAELVSADHMIPDQADLRLQPSFSDPGSVQASGGGFTSSSSLYGAPAIADCWQYSRGVELLLLQTADHVVNQEKSTTVEHIDICTWVDEELNRIIQEELCAAAFSSKLV